MAIPLLLLAGGLVALLVGNSPQPFAGMSPDAILRASLAATRSAHDFQVRLAYSGAQPYTATIDAGSVDGVATYKYASSTVELAYENGRTYGRTIDQSGVASPWQAWAWTLDNLQLQANTFELSRWAHLFDLSGPISRDPSSSGVVTLVGKEPQSTEGQAVATLDVSTERPYYPVSLKFVSKGDGTYNYRLSFSNKEPVAVKISSASAPQTGDAAAQASVRIALDINPLFSFYPQWNSAQRDVYLSDAGLLPVSPNRPSTSAFAVSALFLPLHQVFAVWSAVSRSCWVGIDNAVGTSRLGSGAATIYVRLNGAQQKCQADTFNVASAIPGAVIDTKTFPT